MYVTHLIFTFIKQMHIHSSKMTYWASVSVQNTVCQVPGRIQQGPGLSGTWDLKRGKYVTEDHAVSKLVHLIMHLFLFVIMQDCGLTVIIAK